MAISACLTRFAPPRSFVRASTPHRRPDSPHTPHSLTMALRSTGHPPITLIRNGTHTGVLHDIAHGKVVINDEPGKCTLEQLGDFTGAVGEILVRRVAAAPGCKLLPQSKVRQLRIMSANESSLVIDIAGCSTVTAQVGSVVLATGGTEHRMH